MHLPLLPLHLHRAALLAVHGSIQSTTIKLHMKNSIDTEKKQNPNTVRTFYFDWFNFIIVRTVHSFICYIWLIHISLTFPFQQVKKYFSLALFSLFICTQIGIVCIRLFLFYFVKFLLIVFFLSTHFLLCVCVCYISFCSLDKLEFLGIKKIVQIGSVLFFVGFWGFHKMFS